MARELTIDGIMSVNPAQPDADKVLNIDSIVSGPARPNPLEGVSVPGRMMIGAGRRMVDLGRGTIGLAGKARLVPERVRIRNQAAIDEAAKINAPLDDDLAAMAGSFLPDVLIGGGLSGLGGAVARRGFTRAGQHLAGATFKGAAATGAIQGAIEPTTSGNEAGTLLNMGVGAVAGPTGLLIGNVGGKLVNSVRGQYGQNAGARALDLSGRRAGIDLSLPSLTGPIVTDAGSGRLRSTFSPILESGASLLDPTLSVKRGRDREAAQVRNLIQSARASGPDDARQFVEGVIRQFRTVEGDVNTAYQTLRDSISADRFQTTPVVADQTREALRKLYRSFPQVLSKKAGLVPEEARLVMGRLLGDVREDLTGFLDRYGDQLSDGARNRLRTKADGDKIVTTQQLQRLVEGLPPALQTHLQTALSADRRTMSFDEANGLRQAMGGILGQLTKQEATGAASPLALRGMKNIYGSLARDIEAWGGDAVNREVMQNFRTANDMYRDRLLPFYGLPKFRQVLDSATPDQAGGLTFDWSEYSPDNAARDFLKKGQPEMVAGLFDFSDAQGRAAGTRVLEDAALGLPPPTRTGSAGQGLPRSEVPPSAAQLDSAAQGYEDALATADPAALGRVRERASVLRAATSEGTVPAPYDAFPLTLGVLGPATAYIGSSLTNDDEDDSNLMAPLVTGGALAALGLAGRGLRNRAVKSVVLADRPLIRSGLPVVPATSAALQALDNEQE
ncbi:hypothetical protein UFOVP435_11 [uncultured Caudovirales phage]|uniref:Uncharacterized protein n=1 Tax=uncultured Caudovirales phage TaxID=2100421 RepID=A0A6J5M6N8_9CAUD|nr:hypothetical protein UFOVP435_11 [uncultured Caudovirales phage]